MGITEVITVFAILATNWIVVFYIIKKTNRTYEKGK